MKWCFFMFLWLFQSPISAILFIHPINVNKAFFRENYVIDAEVFILQCFRKAVTKPIPSSMIIFIKGLKKLDFIRKSLMSSFSICCTNVQLIPVSAESHLVDLCGLLYMCFHTASIVSRTRTPACRPEQSLWVLKWAASFIFHIIITAIIAL